MVRAYIQKNEKIWNWWQEFQFLSHTGAKIPSKQEVQDLARRQAVAFWLPEAQQEKVADGMLHPAWPGWNEEISSLHHSRAARTSRRWGEPKWWHWLGPSRGVPCNQGLLWVDCGAIQDLHWCITYLMNTDSLLSISMLDVAEGKTLTSLKSMEKTGPPDEPESWEEESTAAHTPTRPEASEQEGTGSSGGLAIVWRWLPPAPPGFTGSWADESDSSPIGHGLAG